MYTILRSNNFLEYGSGANQFFRELGTGYWRLVEQLVVIVHQQIIEICEWHDPHRISIFPRF